MGIVGRADIGERAVVRVLVAVYVLPGPVGIVLQRVIDLGDRPEVAPREDRLRI
jgi:hypothetical protein